jgi:UDP-N-acetylmuramate: L-alanyl-gamma-D-glutamyl-meso-diaminopimelate ligase
MIFEGDEYLTSPIDRRPKFHLYKPDIALLSGVAWDHINVFPTFDHYVEQFTTFINMITPGGTLIWCSEDDTLRKICPSARHDLKAIPYGIPAYQVSAGRVEVAFGEKWIPLKIFGQHNLMNLNGARLVCNELGISDDIFYKSIGSFSGAAKRLEKVAERGQAIVFKDFAHAPSKVKATLQAVREQFPGQHLVACLELHTFSSLSKEFLGHYQAALDPADTAIVYFSSHALALKRLPMITPEQIREGFGNQELEIFTDPVLLSDRLKKENPESTIFLMMSSGNYDGLEVQRLLEP